MHAITALIRRLWEREFIRFIAMGGVVSVLVYIAYLLLLNLMEYRLANIVSYLGGLFFSYGLNARYVFRQPLVLKQALQYPLVYLVQLALSTLFLTGLVEGLHLPETIAPPLSITLTVPVTFLMSRLILRPAAVLPAEPPASPPTETHEAAAGS